MGYIKQLAGQTFVYGLGIVIPRLLNYLLLTPFYTRIFNQAEYGVVTELYAYLVFLLVILTYGMETGFFRFADKKNNKHDVYKTTLVSLFLSSFLFILLILVFIKPVSEGIGYVNNPQYIKWIALIVAIDAFTSIPFAKLRLENKAFRYSFIRILEVIINIIANWFFLYYCPLHYHDSVYLKFIYNPDIGVGYVFLCNLFASGIKLLLLLPDIFIKKGKGDIILFKKMLVYSFPLLIAGLAGTINEALDRILLKHLIADDPMAKLGVYGANYKLAVLMTLFIQMFRYAAEPFFFSKKDESNAKQIYADVLTFFVFAGMLVYLIVMLFLPYFSLFIGKDFREGVKIVPVILIANLFMGIFYNLSVWYKITGQTKFGAYFVVIGAIITVVINVIFIPEYGYFASAWGHFVSYLIMVLLCYMYGRKHFFIPYSIKKILLLMLLPVAMIITKNNFLPGYNFYGIIISIVFMFLYLVLFLKIQNIKLTSLWRLK